MPEYSEKNRARMVKSHEKRILKHIEKKGIATEKSLGDIYGIKKVRLSGNSLRDRSLKNLVKKGKVDYLLLKYKEEGKKSKDQRVFFSKDYETTHRRVLKLVEEGVIEPKDLENILRKLERP